MELRIREMRRRDLDQILEIEELCFPFLVAESFLTELKNPLAQYGPKALS